jgi:hemerythrin-like domain-containing protein
MLGIVMPGGIAMQTQATPRSRPQRAARPPVPALPPLEALDRTHHQMVVVLSELSQLVDQLEALGTEPAVRRSAQQICQFFDTHARQHHAAEEAEVFPALVRKGDKQLIQHVLRLQQDHGWLEEDWMALAPQLQAVAQGYSWYELDALRHGVGVFTTLYHEHIALEESMIYPEARAQMAAEAEGRAQRVAAQGARAA